AMVVELSTLADVLGQYPSASLRLNMTNYEENALAAVRLERQITAAALYKEGKIWAKFPRDRADAAFPANVTGESHQFRNNSLFLSRPVLDPDNNPPGTIFIQSSLDPCSGRLTRVVGI